MGFQSINPADGSVVATFDYLSDEELFTSLQTAQDCFLNDWRYRPAEGRAAILKKAAQLLREKAQEYAGHITREMGKLVGEAMYEVNLSADILDYYARNGPGFIEPQPLADAPGSKVVTEPLGVILGIEPWNFPYYQLARVAGPQLAAGNVLLMKHAPNVPLCALAFAKLFDEAGAPEGAYTNIFCTVDQVGALIDDDRVRGVALTGSERAGMAVAERAGRKLKKAILELGGSDPLIVLEDAPLDHAIEQAVLGRMMNTGQACAGSKRIIVVGADRAEQFLDGFKRRLADLKAGDPSQPSTTLGPIVSEGAMNNLLRQIATAVQAGAKIELGGGRIDRPGFYLEPTILSGIDPDNPLYKEETFGPVASFYVVEDENEAVRLANATDFGLGACIFSADISRAERVGAAIDAGMIFINSCVYTAPEVPFGGIKNSGHGRELAELGIAEFVNKKLVRTAAA
jgi:succinate-semialdehyde dehydrogenase/glutarate-semialdehyde dehydrogenase